MSVVTGKLISFFNGINLQPYQYSHNDVITYSDYHFFNKCPLSLKTDLGFVLFSILCNINYTTVFINNYFTEEIPQKFKFAYLQYYYLCCFVKDLNKHANTNLYLNDSLKNRDFRNCIAHYGLGQYMEERDIVDNDLLKGLTNKAFQSDYQSTKECLYSYLNDLTSQIKEMIFK